MGIPCSGATGGSNRVTGRHNRARLSAPIRRTEETAPMYEKDVIVTTKYGQMPSFVACPDAPEQEMPISVGS